MHGNLGADVSINFSAACTWPDPQQLAKFQPVVKICPKTGDMLAITERQLSCVSMSQSSCSLTDQLKLAHRVIVRNKKTWLVRSITQPTITLC